MRGGEDLYEYLGLASRLLLAAVFLAAAAGKAANFKGFAIPLRGLGLPRWLAGWATGLLIALEAAVGLLLLGGLAPRVAVAGAALLLAGFLSASAYALLTGRRVACYCFGTAASNLGWETAARSALMALPLAAYATAPALTAPAGWTARFAAGATTLALTLALLLLARWAMALPLGIGVYRSRKAAEVEIRQEIESGRLHLGEELVLEEAT
jgi:uncharacterized membrane protein YphA (DoxX/SURF4 family)